MFTPRFSPGDILISSNPRSVLRAYQVIIVSKIERAKIHYYPLFFPDMYLFITKNTHRSLDTIDFVERSLYPYHYSGQNMTRKNLTPEALAKLDVAPMHGDILEFEYHEVLVSMDQFQAQHKLLEAYTKPRGAFPRIHLQDFENIHTLFYDNIFSLLLKPPPLPLPPTITL